MSWRIQVEFLRETYDASSVLDNALPEWPPHPARVFNALVDAASLGDVDRADAALEALEQLEPPLITIQRSSIDRSTRLSSERIAYVPTNQSTSKAGDVWKTSYPARVQKGPRVWPRTASGPTVTMTWEQDLDPGVLAALTLLAKQVGYLGRATTPVVFQCLAGDHLPLGDEVVLRPNDGFDGIEVSVARPGYLAALRSAYEHQRPAHQVPRRWVAYREERSDDSVPSAFEPPRPVAISNPRDPRSVMLITSRLRAALESILDPAPAVLNGHPAEGQQGPRHQVAFIGLSSNVSEHADGFVRGIGLVVPRGLDPEGWGRILEALASVPEVNLGRAGQVRFETSPRTRSVALWPSTWSRPSSEWATVTPLVADRYLHPDDEAGWADQVRRSCRHVDLPEPEEIEVSQVPWTTGALRASSYDTRRPLPRDAAKAATRRSERPKPAMHVRIRFAARVRGPVLLGNLRYYGLGLCLPLDRKEAGDTDEH